MLLASLALGSSLAGCVVVPIPVARTSGADPAYRSNLGEQAPPSLVQGSTTRRQVLLELGEPDGRGLDDQWFTYTSVSRRGGLHWAYYEGWMGGGGRIGSIDNWDTAQWLTIRFDDRGIVSSVSLDRKNCTNSFVDTHDCTSPRETGPTAADGERRKAQLMAASGLVLGPYTLPIERESGPGCSFNHLAPGYVAALTVTQCGLVWRYQASGQWGSLAFEDIEDVKAVEGHLPPRLPILSRDGSCLFILGEVGRGQKVEDLRPQIVTAVAASRAERQ